jgi:chaperonin cofactor prefoldin
METSVITTLISTSGAVIVGLGGMWISTNQVGKRIDSLERRFESLERRFERLEDEFRLFKEVVTSKLAALDSDIAKLMDGRG